MGLILVVTFGFILGPTVFTLAETRGYYDPQNFNLDLDKYNTCWPKDASTTTRTAVSVSVHLSECYEISEGYPDDEVRIVIIRRTDQKSQDVYNYIIGPDESTPTISGNGYPLEVHVQWLNGEPGGSDLGTKVIGYINWYMN